MSCHVMSWDERYSNSSLIALFDATTIQRRITIRLSLLSLSMKVISDTFMWCNDNNHYESISDFSGNDYNIINDEIIEYNNWSRQQQHLLKAVNDNDSNNHSSNALKCQQSMRCHINIHVCKKLIGIALVAIATIITTIIMTMMRYDKWQQSQYYVVLFE